MSKNIKIRYGWLKGMYVYTIIGAGGFGLGIIFAPKVIGSLFCMPIQDSVVLGITGSVYLSFAILSILGLRSPLKFIPILLLQLSYKVIWFIGVILPIVFTGNLQTYVILYIIVFTTYIIGDLIAIPFSYVFSKQSD
jgi:hypothetical protein